MKLAENYDQLKAAFKPVLVEINDIIERKEIMVCGQPVTLDIVYLQYITLLQFLMLVMGMNAAYSLLMVYHT